MRADLGEERIARLIGLLAAFALFSEFVAITELVGRATLARVIAICPNPRVVLTIVDGGLVVPEVAPAVPEIDVFRR